MPYDWVPASLPMVDNLRRYASGRAWLAELPQLITEFSERWEVRPGAPFHGGSCSWAAPAWRRGGTETLVLKITWPHPEAASEATGLLRWSGRGAVRVHAHDPERYAQLLERCLPGTPLARAAGCPAEERLACAADVLRDLWSAPLPAFGPADTDTAPGTSARSAGSTTTETALPDVPPLAGITRQWADLAQQRAARAWPDGIDTGLFALAAELLRKLPDSAEQNVLLHGDFNPGNVLAARRRPWVAIDPKPMTGEPGFDPWPLIEQVDDPFAHPEPRRVLTRRTAMLADLLGQDVQRIRAWAVARHVQYTLWSVVDDADPSRSISLLEQARLLADVAEL